VITHSADFTAKATALTATATFHTHPNPGHSRAELSAFVAAGLEELSFDDLLELQDPGDLPVRRFRVLYRAKPV